MTADPNADSSSMRLASLMMMRVAKEGKWDCGPSNRIGCIIHASLLFLLVQNQIVPIRAKALCTSPADLA